MITYKGKYPKRINSIYSLKAGGYGATLNDGTLIKFDKEALSTLKWATGYQPNRATYTVIGQSKHRCAHKAHKLLLELPHAKAYTFMREGSLHASIFSKDGSLWVLEDLRCIGRFRWAKETVIKAVQKLNTEKEAAHVHHT